jgi:serine/threonine-protein kinase
MADASKRSAATMSQLLPGSVFAGYKIECVIDRGGMGVVYKAIDPDLDRPVALKIIAPEHSQNETAVARFKAECKLAASLEHPNIVPIHRGGQYEDVLYLAMRFVPGTNLREIIDQGPMDLPRIARIIHQVGSALDVAHDRGLVHRDVKPANILISGTGDHEQVYLTDFGLTKRLGSMGALTRTGGWVGTPDYVAPEQIQGHNVDRRADVYSLGCVLFEMLTGRVAYAKGSDMAKLWAHVTDPPPLPRTQRPELVEDFDDVVGRATAKDPEDRFATAGALAAAVDDAVGRQRQADQRRAAAPPAMPADVGPGATREESFAASPRRGTGTPPRPDREPAGVGAGPPPPDPPADAAFQEPPPPPPRGAAGVPAAGRREPPPPARRTGRGSGGGGGWFGRHRGPVIGALLVAVLAVAAFALLGGSDDKTAPTTAAAPPGQRINGNLGAVPTNKVNGDGTGTMRLNKRSLTVSINTKGLLNGAPHAVHIHAGGKGTCPNASAAALHNGHRSIATHAGVPFYGGAVQALTTRGDITVPRSLVAFSRYPNTSDVKYRRTIKVTPIVASYIKKNNAVLVVHGIDYNHNGVYDGVLERSDLDRSLTGESTAPALCGPLVAEKPAKATTSKSKTAQLRPRSGPTVYRVALAAPAAPAPPPLALLCPLGTSGHAEFRPA